MTFETHDALEALIGSADVAATDSITATIQAGASTTVLPLASGEAAQFEPKMRVHLSGATLAPTGNDKITRSVKEVDTGLDTITVWPALPATPSNGDTIGAGVLEWLNTGLTNPATAITYMAPQWSAPAMGLLDSADRHGCLLYYGMAESRPGVFASETQPWEFHAIGQNLHWIRGLLSRIHRLLHREALTLGFANHEFTRVDFAQERTRADVLREMFMAISIGAAEVAA